MNPLLMYGTGAAVGGIGSYFGGQAQAQAQEQQTAEQAREFNAQMANTLAQKQAATSAINSGYNTTGYGNTLDYQNPYQSGMDTSINAMMSGSLTPAEISQQAKDIAAGSQGVNANASTMGLTAGGRAALQGQNASNITANYANMAGARVGQGVTAANTAANTGANIASMDYQSGLNNFLQQQAALNAKVGLQAQYAPGTAA